MIASGGCVNATREDSTPYGHLCPRGGGGRGAETFPKTVTDWSRTIVHGPRLDSCKCPSAPPPAGREEVPVLLRTRPRPRDPTCPAGSLIEWLTTHSPSTGESQPRISDRGNPAHSLPATPSEPLRAPNPPGAPPSAPLRSPATRRRPNLRERAITLQADSNALTAHEPSATLEAACSSRARSLHLDLIPLRRTGRARSDRDQP